MLTIPARDVYGRLAEAANRAAYVKDSAAELRAMVDLLIAGHPVDPGRMRERFEEVSFQSSETHRLLDAMCRVARYGTGSTLIILTTEDAPSEP